MISVIIPTYERAYSLELVLPYIALQKEVGEIIVVDDAGEDRTYEVINNFIKIHPSIFVHYLRNETNRGASASRQRGLSLARFPYIAFCDDDDFLAPGYFSKCLEAIERGASIASGVHFYRLPQEDLIDAIDRFKSNARVGKLINTWTIMLNKDVLVSRDEPVPFTHGLIVTKKSILERFPVDSGFSSGNGFREESDFQLRAFAHGEKIVMVADAYAIGLNRKEVPTGGQRVSRLKRFYWTIYYNHQFLLRHWPVLATALHLSYSGFVAQAIFVIHEIYRFFLRPFLLLPAYLFKRLLKRSKQ